MKAASTVLLCYADHNYRTAQRRLVASAVARGIGRIDALGPADLRRYAWARHHRSVLRAHRGAGYWLWKPYLILETLLGMSPRQFLIYSDAGADLVASPDPLLGSCVDHELLVFQCHGHLNRSYVKRDCFVALGCDEPRFWEAEQISAGFIVARRTPFTISLLSEWIAWADSLDLITDAPNRLGHPDLPGFIDHRHDQSLLSLLAEKRGLPRWPDPSQWGEPYRRQPDGSFKPYPTIFNLHRSRSLSWYRRSRRRLWAWFRSL